MTSSTAREVTVSPARCQSQCSQNPSRSLGNSDTVRPLAFCNTLQRVVSIMKHVGQQSPYRDRLLVAVDDRRLRRWERILQRWSCLYGTRCVRVCRLAGRPWATLFLWSASLQRLGFSGSVLWPTYSSQSVLSRVPSLPTGLWLRSQVGWPSSFSALVRLASDLYPSYEASS